MHVRSGYGLDDMVQDLNQHMLQQKHHFQKERGSSSTFVYRILENRCRDIAKSHIMAKRKAQEVVSLDWPTEVPLILAQEDEERRLQQSRMAVETFIQFASDPLKELVGDLFGFRRYRYSMHMDQPSLQQEARKLAYTHHVTIDDFRTVIKKLL